MPIKIRDFIFLFHKLKFYSYPNEIYSLIGLLSLWRFLLLKINEFIWIPILSVSISIHNLHISKILAKDQKLITEHICKTSPCFYLYISVISRVSVTLPGEFSQWLCNNPQLLLLRMEEYVMWGMRVTVHKIQTGSWSNKALSSFVMFCHHLPLQSTNITYK